MNSCLCKLFFQVINNRIIDFVNCNNKLSEYQIGFRAGCRTSDHIFVLKTLTDIYKKKKKKLFSCFVDLQKAYETVWHNGLFYKLLQTGISAKIVRLLQDLYKKTSSCVKLNNSISDYFDVSVGVRQGCVLSPILFNIYVDGIVKDILNVNTNPAMLGQMKVPLLMYADDIVLLSESAPGLQNGMNAIHTFCLKWGLKINSAKTKVLIFNTRIGNKISDFKINEKD